VFVHGVGGAKYDQVTDQMIVTLLGIDPPAYLTATATLRLTAGQGGVQPEQLRAASLALRDMTFHPETFIDLAAAPTSPPLTADAARELIETKRRWIGAEPDIRNARQRCRAIRHVNEALQPWIADQRRQLQSQQERLATLLQAQELLASREFSFCLYPKKRIHDFYAGNFAH
jgi:hypothetical protein